MRVNQNSEPLNSEPIGATRTSSQPGARKADLGADQLSFTSTAVLNGALEQVPDTRADKVAQAKSLVADTTYPPPELIRRISALIARQLNAQTGPDRATSN